MRHKYTISCMALILFAIFSCINKNEERTINKLFSETLILKNDNVCIEGKDLAQIEGISCNNKSLIVLDYHSGKSYSLFNIDSCKLIGRFGSIGQGPGELSLGTEGYIENNNFYLFYDQTGFIGKQSIDSLYMNINSHPDPIAKYKIPDAQFSKVISVNDSLFIGAGTYKSKYQFALFDRLSNIIDYNMDIYNINDNTFNEYHKFLSNQGVLRKRPNGNQFVYSLNFSANIDFMEVQNNKIQLIKSIRLQKPDYRPITDDNLNRVLPSNDNIIGYIGLCATEKYVYALYTDKKLFADNKWNDYSSNKILVFDWNGNPIKIIELKKNVYYICVNEESGKIYAAIINSNLGWSIVSYDMLESDFSEKS